MNSIACRCWIPAVAAAIVLSACKSEEQTTRVKELEEQTSEQQLEVDSLNRQLQNIEADRDKLREELSELKRQANAAKSELESFRRKEANAALAKAAADKAAAEKSPKLDEDDAKKAIREHLPAVWVVQGDKSESRALLVEADGKTWLYMPATFLSNNVKLAVKDGAGAPVTKFGEFQVAANANLARLQVSDDAAVRFKPNPENPLGEPPRFMTAMRGAGSAAPKIEEISAGAVDDAAIELNAYGLTQASGDALFNADSGTLVGMIVPGQTESPGLWETPAGSAQPATFTAVRLDRAIEWKPSTIGALAAEKRKIHDLNASSRLMSAAAALAPGAAGLQTQGMIPDANKNARAVLEDHKTNPAVQQLLKLDENLAAKKVRMSEKDVARQFTGILGSLGAANRRLAAELRAMKVSPPNRTDAENALKWNEQAEQKLADTIARSK